jgi:hypothetical protein
MKPAGVSLVLFVVLAWSGKAPAHEDHIIKIKDDKLVGLPDKYAPAEISLKESRLRIGDHVMVFSPLLKSLFDLPHDLKLTASWYHDPKIVPPYLVIAIQPKGKDFSYKLMLNLDTLDLIELSVTLRESEKSTRLLPIALSDEEKEDIRKSVRKVR